MKGSSSPSIRESLPHCRCDVLQNPWRNRSLPSQPTKVIAYIRTDSESPSHEEQAKLIQQYCERFGYEVIETFEDSGEHPGVGLVKAMEALKEVGGLIASDLDRFVYDKSDRLRDLKPFLHEFFCSTQKHLFTVKEGVNTDTPTGQQNVVELLSAVKEFD